MSSESVQVMVRVRPMNNREISQNHSMITEADASSHEITIVDPAEAKTQKTFTFDAVFPAEAQQDAIYEQAARPLVDSVMNGYNGTIFAYGQTGCGKTHTMMGNSVNEESSGIIPRAFKHIFTNIESAEQISFLVRCSYIEIYNEEIHDLLGPNINSKLELKESVDGGVYIKNLSLFVVRSVEDLENHMLKGTKNRRTGETNMNKDSSRSHSIFTIYIESSETDSEEKQRVKLGKLNFVDLAGSERQSKTRATGDRLKEANKINLSLTNLGKVISALVDGKSTHIPYRDSKLTRLLQDSLGGNTKTVMIANLSPSSDSYDETLGTLRYASRAKSIKNKPRINEDPKDTLIREYSEEISRLKLMLGGVNSASENSSSGNKKETSDMAVQNSVIFDQGRQEQASSEKETMDVAVQYSVMFSQVRREQVNSSKKETSDMAVQNSVIFDEGRQEQASSKKETMDIAVQNSIMFDQVHQEQVRFDDLLQAKDEEIASERRRCEELERRLNEMRMLMDQRENESEGTDDTHRHKEMIFKLEEQDQIHQELLREREIRNEEFEMIGKEYENLQGEVIEYKATIKKLRRRMGEVEKDMIDLQQKHETDRGALQGIVGLLERELKKENAMLRHVLSSEGIADLRTRLMYHEESKCYRVCSSNSSDATNALPSIRRDTVKQGLSRRDITQTQRTQRPSAVFNNNAIIRTEPDLDVYFNQNSQQRVNTISEMLPVQEGYGEGSSENFARIPHPPQSLNEDFEDVFQVKSRPKYSINLKERSQISTMNSIEDTSSYESLSSNRTSHRRAKLELNSRFDTEASHSKLNTQISQQSSQKPSRLRQNPREGKFMIM